MTDMRKRAMRHSHHSTAAAVVLSSHNRGNVLLPSETLLLGVGSPP